MKFNIWGKIMLRTISGKFPNCTIQQIDYLLEARKAFALDPSEQIIEALATKITKDDLQSDNILDEAKKLKMGKEHIEILNKDGISGLYDLPVKCKVKSEHLAVIYQQLMRQDISLMLPATDRMQELKARLKKANEKIHG